MRKLLTEYYPLIMVSLWVSSLPLVAKDAFGFVPSLCAAIIAVAIGIGLVKATMQRSLRTKALSLLASVLVISALVGLFGKKKVSPTFTDDIEAEAL